VPPEADLCQYRLVLAPALYLVSPDVADNLQGYVESGGTLLITARSGVKDEVNAVVNMPLPGLLADVCGVEVAEYDALHPDAQVPVEMALPDPTTEVRATRARLWCDILAPTTAQTVARYQGEYYAGRAAITLNRFGQGQAVYVGTLGDKDLIDSMVGWAVARAAVSPALTTPHGVEAVERWKEGRRLLFLLNHADAARDVVLPQRMTDLLTDRVVAGQATLAPKAVMILCEV
jgi:beta-galactosidase